MTQDTIFARRKELKKKSHGVVKKHYLLLVFLMLAMTLFGTEFRYSISSWEDVAPQTEEEAEEGPGNRLSDDKIFSPGEVFDEIISGRLAAGDRKAEEQAQRMKDRLADSSMLGMTNGILAQVVNTVMSGRLFSRLGQTIRTITHSDAATSLIFVLGAFLWYALIFYFFKNVFSAIIRRIYLAARIYQEVPLSDVTWFAVVRKWRSACRVMFVTYIYSVLWSFTIVGGIIKYFSYFAVPYIVAENPGITPKRAITLSRRMMNGHKMELFKYMLSFIGWHLLSLVTIGISDLAYGNAYRLAAYSEYYAVLREEALAAGQDDIREILNDQYLFEKADRIALYEAYFDVVDEIADIHENRITPTGWHKVLAEWFGIWTYSFEKKKAYDRQEERSLGLIHNKQCMQGEAYPERLSPLWKERKDRKQVQFSFIRSYMVWTLFLLFIAFCFLGWSWEVALHYMQTGQFANRGTLHGPWLPIYGTGGLIVLLLCSRFRKNPVAEFFTAIVLCGILEYFSAWSLEMRYHQRWWSYDGYFLNLHGRICAEGLLVFGVGCCAVVYLVAPLFDHMLSMVKQKILIVICVVLAVAFTADMVYSRFNPNMAEGAVESTAPETEILTETESAA